MTDIIERGDIVVIVDAVGVNELEAAEAAQAAAEAAQATAEEAAESVEGTEINTAAQAAQAASFAILAQAAVRKIGSLIASAMTTISAHGGAAASAAQRAGNAARHAYSILTQVMAFAADAANSRRVAKNSANAAQGAATTARGDATSAMASAAIASRRAQETAADRVQTGLDAIATAADRVQTGVHAASTAADAVATAADRVQTGLDASTATTQAGLAQAAATAAANSLDSFDDRYLGAKAADPTLDNDGNALLDGALYWNTSTGLKIYHLGTTTWNAYSAATGLGNVVEDTTPQLGGQLDVNGFALGDGTNELLKFEETASAVNELTVVNAATGNGPTLKATGNDTNVDLNLAGKGTGVPKIGGAAALKASGTQNLTGGFTCTPYDFGTLTTTQTITPNPSSGPRQKVTCGAATFTLTIAATAEEGSLVLDLIFANSSGTVTINTSGFDKTYTGDAITATNGNKYRLYIENTGGVQSLATRALQ